MAEDVNARLDLLQTALQAAVTASGSGRGVSRDLRDWDQYQDAELGLGVWVIAMQREADFAEHRQPEAELGVQRVGIVGRCKVREDQTGAAVEAIELDMVLELKSIHTYLDPEITGYRLLNYRTSGQFSVPYGFVAAEAELRP